jgi:hypothetical protein
LSSDLTAPFDADIFDDATLPAIGVARALPCGAPSGLGPIPRNAQEVLKLAALRRGAVICKMFRHSILRLL